MTPTTPIDTQALIEAYLVERFQQQREEDIAYLKSERHTLLMRLAAVEKRLKAYGVEFKHKEGK